MVLPSAIRMPSPAFSVTSPSVAAIEEVAPSTMSSPVALVSTVVRKMSPVEVEMLAMPTPPATSVITMSPVAMAVR